MNVIEKKYSELLDNPYVKFQRNELTRWRSNWELLKHALINKFNETQNTIYLDILTDIMQPLEEKKGE